MRRSRRFLAIAAVLLAGCVSTAVPVPESPETAVIGARGWVNLPGRSGHQDSSSGADGFYFVKFPVDGDPTRVTEILETNYRQGATHYLFNAAPGRYAVIGCYRKRDGRRANVYFSAQTIRESATDVGRAKLVFLGSYNVRASYTVSKADDAQRHYFRTLDPKYYRAGVLDRMISPTDALLARSATLDREGKSAQRFRDRATSLLKETGWPSHFAGPSPSSSSSSSSSSSDKRSD